MWLFLSSQEEDMPEEVNIDELLDLQSDEERTQKLKVSVFWNYWWRNQYVVGLYLTSLKEHPKSESYELLLWAISSFKFVFHIR